MKNIRNRVYRRDILFRKYISRLKKNLYWLWLDNLTPLGENKNLPKNWKELDKGCKFAKSFKNGGNPEKRLGWEKIWRKKEAERKKGYPKDKIKDDEREISYAQDTINFASGNWEHYCGSCDIFDTNFCPFYNKVDDITNWQNINCKAYLN